MLHDEDVRIILYVCLLVRGLISFTDYSFRYNYDLISSNKFWGGTNPVVSNDLSSLSYIKILCRKLIWFYFYFQPLYETQNVKREYQKRVSSSSQSSQGSGDPSLHYSHSRETSEPPQQRYNPPQHSRGSGDYPPQAYQQPPHLRGQQQGEPSVQHYHQQQQQQQQQGMSVISNNLSELDQLLSDLNSAQFMAEVDKKQPSGAPGLYSHCFGYTLKIMWVIWFFQL